MFQLFFVTFSLAHFPPDFIHSYGADSRVHWTWRIFNSVFCLHAEAYIKKISYFVQWDVFFVFLNGLALNQNAYLHDFGTRTWCGHTQQHKAPKHWEWIKEHNRCTHHNKQTWEFTLGARVSPYRTTTHPFIGTWAAYYKGTNKWWKLDLHIWRRYSNCTTWEWDRKNSKRSVGTNGIGMVAR